MSIEMHVLFSGKLPSRAALARAMKELGFPLTIPSSVGSLELHRGYMPMRMRREETGVEFDTFNSRSDVEEVAGEDIDPRFDRSANFRWGGDQLEMLAGICGAAALAKLVNGVVLDDEEDLLLTPDEAAASAKRHLEAHLGKAEPPGGMRPVGLERYLKPLLERRKDLVLVGRMLLVRPVRHLLRGAFFDRTSDKYRLRVYRYVDPLYFHKGPYGIGDDIHDGLWYVWQPHFQSLLIDSLADDLFSQLGKITTLDDFAGLPYRTGQFLDAQMISLFLMGGRDHAEEYLRRIERDDRVEDDWKKILRGRFGRVTDDVKTLCAQAHAREAETVKYLKLDHIWEPSRFPVELPAGERSKAAEPFFPVDPWIPRPESLIAEAPDSPGEIRYAKQWFRRDGRPVLAALLTPEAAEERHRAREAYKLLVRLPDGFLFMISRNRGDRNEPPQFGVKPEPREDLYAELHGSAHYATAQFFQTGVAIFELSSLRVEARSGGGSRWHCHIDLEKNEKTIHSDTYSKAPLTSAERGLATCGLPGFGEYEDLAKRLRFLLQVAGYGVLT